jgi:hypothetical protein
MRKEINTLVYTDKNIKIYYIYITFNNLRNTSHTHPSIPLGKINSKLPIVTIFYKEEI